MPTSASAASSSSILLPSNDDDLERAHSRARAHKSAAFRRKPFPPLPPPSSPPSDHHGFIDRLQLLELYRNCIRLAAENKINQKNTWELPLIDHLSEIIRVELDCEKDANFHKASCTLEAGMRIYSIRVDSVHAMAYKVLGGINRVGLENSAENILGDHIIADQEGSHSGKEKERKISPLSTLEPSFEALNVKKYDVAFTVDPLYHQTSAQFDEGGVKGLLLNNLGVYGRCLVLFDSFEVPEKSIVRADPEDKSVMIDLSFANEYVEPMVTLAGKDISPTLRDILNQFTDDDSTNTQKDILQDNKVDDIHNDLQDGALDDCGFWNANQDDQRSSADESFCWTDPNFTGHQEESNDYTLKDTSKYVKIGNVAYFLSLNLGFTSKSNAWAGPSYWKFHRTKDLEISRVSTTESKLVNKKMRSKKWNVCEIDFTNFLEKELLHIFAPPKNRRSIMLPAEHDPCHIVLPEDCHYIPDNLCLQKKRGRFSDETGENSYSYPQYDNESLVSDQFQGECAYSDGEDSENLVCQPCQVNKVSIRCDRVSKQVDVHALKEILWNHIQESIQGREATVSLRDTLHHFPIDTAETVAAAASCKDIPLHLFFICILHLANEHCLNLRGYPNLDDLDITIPPSAIVK